MASSFRADMKENGQILPPVWCGGICRNSMNDMCLESCAIKRDCSRFEPAKGLKLIDLPRFPNSADLTREEKFTVVALYLEKIVDHLQGTEDDRIEFPVHRASRSINIDRKKAVVEVVPHITALQIDVQNSEADNRKSQPTQIGIVLSSSLKQISTQEDK